MKQMYLISSPKDDIINRNCEAEYKSPSYLSKILEKRIRNWLQKFDESEGTKKYL